MTLNRRGDFSSDREFTESLRNIGRLNIGAEAERSVRRRRLQSRVGGGAPSCDLLK